MALLWSGPELWSRLGHHSLKRLRQIKFSGVELCSPSVPGSSASQRYDVHAVPLPLTINRTFYEPTLKTEDDSKALQELIDLQSRVSDLIGVIHEGLTNDFACALVRYSRIDDGTRYDLLTAVVSIRLAITETIATVRRLEYLYGALHSAHKDCERSVRETLDLGWLEKFKIRFQSMILQTVGWDPKERFFDPWLERKRGLEKVLFGEAALVREAGRLNEIKQAATQLDETLKPLTARLVAKKSNITGPCGGCPGQSHSLRNKGSKQQSGGGEPEEIRPKDWFRDYMAQYLVGDQDTHWGNLGRRCRA